MKRVVVIGGGLGGLSAALALASRGYSVALHEKNAQLGGKLNTLQKEGFSFDLGPSILTLPQVFEELFGLSGKRFREYAPIVELDVHWRNFFEDGAVIDLLSDTLSQEQEFAKTDQTAPAQFKKFIAYCREQFVLTNKGYLTNGADTFWQVVRSFAPQELVRLDGLRTMNRAIESFIKNEYLRTIFSFFVKYIGSSADRAPAFINLMPWVQYGYGLWYVRGGMYNLAKGYARALEELGVRVNLNSEIVEIITANKTATGVRRSDGEIEQADIVVSNMEVIPAHERLLHCDKKQMKRFKRFEPACSGLILHLGLDKRYPQLAHHNFLFSKDQHNHFASVFERYELPSDPTIYLVAPTRTDALQAPGGCDNLKLLPHIPHIRDENPFTLEDYLRLKEIIIDKCERMGLTDIRDHIVVEHLWTPVDIQNKYYSNRGSIYGVVTDLKKNYALKAPKRSRLFPNLFFVGGSVNPGGGMPMVTLSGMQAARSIERNYPAA